MQSPLAPRVIAKLVVGIIVVTVLTGSSNSSSGNYEQLETDMLEVLETASATTLPTTHAIPNQSPANSSTLWVKMLPVLETTRTATSAIIPVPHSMEAKRRRSRDGPTNVALRLLQNFAVDFCSCPDITTTMTRPVKVALFLGRVVFKQSCCQGHQGNEILP